jgi:hypothetical protein
LPGVDGDDGEGFFGPEARLCGADPVRLRVGADLEVVRGEPEEPGPPAPEPESSRRAVRARDSRERLEKDMTPRYYVPRFQHGPAFVGDC